MVVTVVMCSKSDKGEKMIKNGWYWHFKGGLYEVIGTATHTETGETMVIYHGLNNPEKVWVRPASMWNETVCGVERFQYVGIGLPQHWHDDHKTGLVEVIKSQKNTSPKN